MNDEHHTENLRLLEAVLFATKEPLGERKLANYFNEEIDLKALLKTLQEEYAPKGINLVRRGNAWAFRKSR